MDLLDRHRVRRHLSPPASRGEGESPPGLTLFDNWRSSSSSSRRTPGPIRRGVCDEKRCSTIFANACGYGSPLSRGRHVERTKKQDREVLFIVIAWRDLNSRGDRS